MKYRFTTQYQLRREFWETFPELDARQIPDHSGKGYMYKADTRCTWVDWIDSLSKSGAISQQLAQRATP